jgi:signal peptidase II
MRIKQYFIESKNLYLYAGLIVLLDQLTKYLVRSNLHPGEIFPQGTEIAFYVRLIHWHNYGALGGILPESGGVITIFAILMSIGAIFFYPRISPGDRILRLALIFLLGGALGNLIDRLHQGFVTDFISIGSLPVFNIADMSLGISILLIIIVLGRNEMPNKKKSSTPPVEERQ